MRSLPVFLGEIAEPKFKETGNEKIVSEMSFKWLGSFVNFQDFYEV